MAMEQVKQRRLLSRILCLVMMTSAMISGAVLLSGSDHTVRAATGFVSRCGIHFCLNGKTFYYAGTNNYDIFTFGDGSSKNTADDIENKFMDKAAIDTFFANAQSDQIKVVRTWMFDHEAWHGFETAKGVYNEAEFAEFDYIVQSARTHGIMLTPSLENYWEAWGGIDTRLQWEGLATGQANRWKFFSQQQCPGCFTQYKNYVNHVLNHVNHYSNVAYKDDPTIFSWELINEPRYEHATPDESTTGTTLRAWVDTMGAYVKSIDPNHMVSLGMEGVQASYGYGTDSGNPFVYIYQSPALDFTSGHPYPTESWANLSMEQTRALIKTWIIESHTKVGKPFVLSEFNVRPDAAGSRADWWANVFFSAMQENDGDGDNFWEYVGRYSDATYGVTHGAPELVAFKAHAQYMAQKSGGSAAIPTPTSEVGSTPTVMPSPTVPTETGGCHVHYALKSWSDGFTVTLTITNTGRSAIRGWTLKFAFPGSQRITLGWSGAFTQSGNQVTVTNASFNRSIFVNGSVNPGFNASWSGSNPMPTAFKLNAMACSIS